MKMNKELVKGSFILLIAFGVYNFLNFAFQSSMARLLTIAEFGVLSVLFNIIYVFSGFSDSIQITITKYAANEKDDGKVKNILKRALKKSFLISLILFLVYVLLAFLIAYLTKIDYFLILLVGLLIFIFFLSPITRGLLQGKRKFDSLGINMFFESIIKLFLAIVLVMAGWKVYGAIAGTLIGCFVAFGLSFFHLKDVIKAKETLTSTKEIYQYGAPSFFIVITILIFYGFDVFLAKIFFPSEIAGKYAIASLMAKIIFFGTQPISRAMFPISAEKNIKKDKSKNIFMNAFLLVCVGIAAVLAFFYFFPDFVIEIFSGKIIPEAANILFYLGIATSLLSITNLILLYKLSLGKTKGCVHLLVFAIIEISLVAVYLGYFHANLFQYSIALIAASAIFLWGVIFLLNE
ncbi:oligosaccharide flippase family protein [Candidatus Pacearchaeota archaeon]|nr:oligosaccharide flippase family protein [Candidatus Pacearchaeota archaeon]